MQILSLLLVFDMAGCSNPDQRQDQETDTTTSASIAEANQEDVSLTFSDNAPIELIGPNRKVSILINNEGELVKKEDLRLRVTKVSGDDVEVNGLLVGVLVDLSTQDDVPAQAKNKEIVQLEIKPGTNAKEMKLQLQLLYKDQLVGKAKELVWKKLELNIGIERQVSIKPNTILDDEEIVQCVYQLKNYSTETADKNKVQLRVTNLSDQPIKMGTKSKGMLGIKNVKWEEINKNGSADLPMSNLEKDLDPGDTSMELILYMSPEKNKIAVLKLQPMYDGVVSKQEKSARTVI